MYSLQEIKFLIHKIANTDFDKSTIKLNNNFIKIITIKRRFISSSSINSQIFNEALNKLVNLIHSNPSILKDSITRSELCILSNKLIDHIVGIPDLVGAHNAYNIVSNLVNEVALTQWQFSIHSIGTVIDQLPLTDGHKNVLRNNFIDKEGHLFLQRGVLSISSSFFSINSSEAETRRQIQEVLDRHPSISSVQIQGYLPITRQGMQRVLRDDRLSIKIFGIPFAVTWENHNSTMTLNPMLFPASEYLLTLLNFRVKQKSQEDRILLSEISPEIFNLINKHIEDLNLLEINTDNFLQLFLAQDYLVIPQLLDKCNDYLSKLVEDLEEDQFDTIFEIHQTLQKMGHASAALSQKVIESWAVRQPDTTTLINRIQGLTENEFKFNQLNLSSFPDITDLELSQILEVCPALTALDLSGCSQLTTAIGPKLAQLQKLEELNLSLPTSFAHGWDGISDEIVKNLQGLPQLKKLNLANRKMTDAIGPVLEDLKQLEELNLGQTFVSTNICQHLKNLENLKTLNLRNIPLINTDLSLLVELKLRNLNLNHCCLKDDSVSSISQFTHLIKLDLANNFFTDNIGPGLPKLPGLQALNLSGNDYITTQTGSFLSLLKELRVLNLAHCNNMGNSLILDLARLPNLQELDLSDSHWLTNKNEKEFEYFQKLRKLNLSGCWSLKPSIGKSLAKLPELRELNYSRSGPGEEIGLEFSELVNLRHLDISHCRFSKKLFAKLTKLKQLNLTQCLITKELISKLTKLPNLKELDLTRGKELTNIMISKLAKMPQLREINLTFCDHVLIAEFKKLLLSANSKIHIIDHCPIKLNIKV